MKAGLKLVVAVALAVLWWDGPGSAQDQKASGDSQPQQQGPAAPQTSSPASQAPTQEPGATAPAQTDQPKSVPPDKAAPATAKPCATCAPTPAKPAPAGRKRRKKAVHATAASQANASGASTGTSSGTTSATPNATSPTLPEKIVVRNGGAKDDTVQLSPGGGRDQESHNRESTVQLLATTDVNLKKLAGRQLTSAQQVTLDQIHSYVVQANLASTAGDLFRARTLAYKARLLSDDLSKP